jgi:hypothetical protein
MERDRLVTALGVLCLLLAAGMGYMTHLAFSYKGERDTLQGERDSFVQEREQLRQHFQQQSLTFSRQLQQAAQKQGPPAQGPGFGEQPRPEGQPQ